MTLILPQLMVDQTKALFRFPLPSFLFFQIVTQNTLTYLYFSYYNYLQSNFMADGCSIGTVDLDSLKRKPWIVKGQFLPCIFISFIYRHSLRGKNKYARIVLQNKKGQQQQLVYKPSIQRKKERKTALPHAERWLQPTVYKFSLCFFFSTSRALRASMDVSNFLKWISDLDL